MSKHISSVRVSHVNRSNADVQRLSLLTCVGFSATVRPGRGSPISCLHLESEGALGLSVEDLLGEHLPRLRVDLEAVLALVADAVHDVVVHLVVWERAVLVDRVYPGGGEGIISSLQKWVSW